MQPQRRVEAFGWTMLPGPAARAQLGRDRAVPRAARGKGRAAAPSHDPTASHGQLCLLNHLPPAGKAGAQGAPLPQPRHWGSLPWDKEGRGWLCPPPWGGPAPLSPGVHPGLFLKFSCWLRGVRGPAGSRQLLPSFPSWHIFFLCTSLNASGVNPASHLP